MRIFVAAFVILALFAALGTAATHEKKVSDEITITQAAKVGDKVLEPGRYRIRCDGHTITFQRLNSKAEKLSFPCNGHEMAQKASTTELAFGQEGNTRVLSKLHLRGSNIEHTF